MTARGLFITGTGTAVGKTHVAAMIVRTLVVSGRRVGPYKPVASGCHIEGPSVVADDAVALWKAAGEPGVLDDVCPQRYLAPLAPPRAAAIEGRGVDANLLREGAKELGRVSDIVIVEGAGGLMSPLSDEDCNIDLARDLGFPLVIVASDELGVINATLQTVIAARALAPALPIAGVVLNQVKNPALDASVAWNAGDLQDRCKAPVLGIVQHGSFEFDAAVDWFALAGHGN